MLNYGCTALTNSLVCSVSAGSESLHELVSSVVQRLGIDGEKGTVQLLVICCPLFYVFR